MTRSKGPEVKCAQCNQPRRCRLHVEMVNGKRIISYLCTGCAKELEAPEAPTTVEGGAA